MKKLLAMVLALVMTLSLAVSANAAFKDADKVTADYSEAVAVLNGMDVFKGYEDGSFKPQGNITRAEVATIIYRIYTGDVAKNDKSGLYATYNKFSDMAGAGWAQGYIGYCANAELVKGYPDGTFKPSGNVTGYEVLAMILRAVGYDKNGEFTGADWALNVAKYAEQLKILKNVDKNTNLGAPATRELVAEILFRAIQQNLVTYTPAFGYVTDKVQKLDQTTLAKKNFKLASSDASDVWGRPTTKWFKDANTNEKFDKGEKVYVEIVATPAATYTVATAQCDICKDLGEKNSAEIVEAYTNGKADKTLLTTYKATATTTKVGAQGQLLEYYEVKDGYRLVVIDTYLAKVLKVTDAKLDSQGHVRSEAELKLDVYGIDNSNFVLKGSDGENFEYKEDEYVLIYVNENDIQDSEIVKTVTASTKKYSGISYKEDELKLDNEWVKFAAKYAEDEDALNDFGKIDVFYDLYDNVIGTFDPAAEKTVVVVDAMYTSGNSKPVFKADLVDTAAENKAYTVDTLTTADAKLEVEDILDREDWNATRFEDKGVYDKLYTYTVNDDETLKVVTVDDSTMGTNAYTDIASKDRYVYFKDSDGDNVGVRFTDETIFLVHENDGTYTSTTGDKMEDISAANVEVMTDDDNYATVVYLYENVTRATDINKVYVPVQKITRLVDQKIDGEIVKCLKVQVLPTEGDEYTVFMPLAADDADFIKDALAAGKGTEAVKVGGFFVNVRYMKDSTIFVGLAIGEKFYTVDAVDSVKKGTVTLDDDATFDLDKVENFYVIKDGKISAGTKDDVKADRYVHAFWTVKANRFNEMRLAISDLYIDLDLTEKVETYNDEIGDLAKDYAALKAAETKATSEYKDAANKLGAALMAAVSAGTVEDNQVKVDMAQAKYDAAVENYGAGTVSEAEVKAAAAELAAAKAGLEKAEKAKADFDAAQAAEKAAKKVLEDATEDCNEYYEKIEDYVAKNYFYSPVSDDDLVVVAK